MEERRKHRRLRMVSHLEVMFYEDGSTINAFSLNISKGGISFCTGKEIERDREVDIRVFFDTSTKQKISETIPGRIKWVKQISRVYEAGVEFNLPEGGTTQLFTRYIPDL